MIRLAVSVATFAAWVGIEINRFILDGIEATLLGDRPHRWDGHS
jgi:hypothetical protein